MQSSKSISRDLSCSTAAAVAAIHGSRRRNRRSSCITRSWISDRIRLECASSLAASGGGTLGAGSWKPANHDLQCPEARRPPGLLDPQRPSEEPIKFLAYHVGRNCLRTTGREYLATRPSAASIRKEISEPTQVQDGLLGDGTIMDRPSRATLGPANHPCLGPVDPDYALDDVRARKRLCQQMCGCTRHGIRGPCATRTSARMAPGPRASNLQWRALRPLRPNPRTALRKSHRFDTFRAFIRTVLG